MSRTHKTLALKDLNYQEFVAKVVGAALGVITGSVLASIVALEILSRTP